MGDMEPVASVHAHTALEHRARCVARSLPGAWEVDTVHNSGDGATLSRRSLRSWTANDLCELEHAAIASGGKNAPNRAHASISARDECVTLRVKFGTERSRWLMWALVLCAIVIAGYRAAASKLRQDASAVS